MDSYLTISIKVTDRHEMEQVIQGILDEYFEENQTSLEHLNYGFTINYILEEF